MSEYLASQYSASPQTLEANSSFIESISSFEPTLEDLHAIIQGVAKCEVEKYRHGVTDPRKMLSEFLAESAYESDFQKLKEKFDISHDK